MRISEEISTIIDALLTPIYYRYDEGFTKLFANTLISLIEYGGAKMTIDDEELEYCFCILVLLYGDYGINPRRGWIEDCYKDDLISQIKRWMGEYVV